MSVHRIPVARLSVTALRGIIGEFVSRAGTDYGAVEVPAETKFRQVRDKLESGSAVLLFDDETETTHIFWADDPILRKLDAPTGS